MVSQCVLRKWLKWYMYDNYDDDDDDDDDYYYIYYYRI